MILGKYSARQKIDDLGSHCNKTLRYQKYGQDLLEIVAQLKIG